MQRLLLLLHVLLPQTQEKLIGCTKVGHSIALLLSDSSARCGLVDRLFSERYGADLSFTDGVIRGVGSVTDNIEAATSFGHMAHILADLRKFCCEGRLLLIGKPLAGCRFHTIHVLLCDQGLVHRVLGAQDVLLRLEGLLAWLGAHHVLVEWRLKGPFKIVDALGQRRGIVRTSLAIVVAMAISWSDFGDQTCGNGCQGLLLELRVGRIDLFLVGKESL